MPMKPKGSLCISGGRVGYEQSKAAGDRGEAIVADILERHRAPEAVVLNDLLFDGVDTTTQVDHILIDRFGLLLVETKFYNALIKGTSEDFKWTACYKDGNRKQFHNPLRQNEGHRGKLPRILQQNGFRLDATYTQNVIVFAHGNIGELNLVPEDRARVLDSADFQQHLGTRADFAPNGGDLEGHAIDAVAQLVSSLDRSSDPAVQARHERMVKEASGRKRRPPTRTSKPRATAHRPAAPRATSRPRRETPAAVKELLGQLSRTAVAALLFGALFATWQLWFPLMMNSLASGLSGANTASVSAPQPPVAAYDAPRALAQLTQAEPALARALVNPDKPELSEVNGLPTYTWECAEKTGGSAAAIRRISISLDSSGRLVGASQE